MDIGTLNSVVHFVEGETWFDVTAVSWYDSTGKELEAAGVLNGAQQKFEENGLWNLPVPFVAPDGALVPYAWKRQIAGQAAASAYDRARYGQILGIIL